MDAIDKRFRQLGLLLIIAAAIIWYLGYESIWGVCGGIGLFFLVFGRPTMSMIPLFLIIVGGLLWYFDYTYPGLILIGVGLVFSLDIV